MIYESRMLRLLKAITRYYAALESLKGSQMIYLYHCSSRKIFSLYISLQTLNALEYVHEYSLHKCINVKISGYPISLRYMDISPSNIRESSNKHRMNFIFNNNNRVSRKLLCYFVLKQMSWQHDL